MFLYLLEINGQDLRREAIVSGAGDRLAVEQERATWSAPAASAISG